MASQQINIAAESQRRGFPRAVGITRADASAMCVLSLVALVVGAILVAVTIDIPGDGPSHAMIAYGWSRHPHYKTTGVWLPGFDYWAGLWMMLIPKPFLIPRLCNLGFATLTVPVFYAMVRKLHGSREALLGTIAFVALPLRIGLSASSLTEISSLFFLLAGLLCLMYAAEDGSIDVIWFTIAVLALVAAEMTRYEVWTFAPLFVFFIYARTRGLSATAIALIVLAIFPFIWSWGNYRASGDPFPGFHILSNAPEGASPVVLGDALLRICRLLRDNLGWLLSIGALLGLLVEFYCVLQRESDANRTSYAIFVAVVWAAIVRGGLLMGPALYPRYLLLAFTLSLPFAAVAYLAIAGRSGNSMVVGVVLIGASLAMPYRHLYPLNRSWTPIFVTRRVPTDIIMIAKWLPSSAYGNDAVVMTKLDWDSTYLPLYLPQLNGRAMAVSVWVPLTFIRQFVESNHPALLITDYKDSAGIARLDDALKRAVEPMLRDPVFVSGALEVYDIRGLTARCASKNSDTKTRQTCN